MNNNVCLNKAFWLSMIALFVCGLFINLQTMFIDEGFYLSNYQTFLKDPTINIGSSGAYLTVLVGGLWDKFFGFGGILSHRIFALLLGCVSFYFTWRLLKEFTKYPLWIFLGCFLPLLHGIGGCMGSISGFILGIASCFLYESYKENSLGKYLVAAILVGMSLFGRFTAILTIFPLFLPTLFNLKNNRRLALQQAFVGVGGYILGIVLVFLLIICMGHFDAYYQSIFVDLVSSGKSEGSTHNIWNLLYVYLKDIGIVFGSVFIVLLLSGLVKKYCLKNLSFYIALLIVVSGALVLLMKILVDKVSPIAHNYVLAVASFTFLILSGKETIKKYDFLVAYIVMRALIGPMGSDVAILGHGCCFLSLSLPMFVSSLSENPYRKRIIYLVLTLCLVYSAERIRRIVMFGTFWDYGPRYEMTYKLEGSKFATIYVSKETKDTMDPLLFELKKYVKPDDELMCFYSIPIIHYFTETRPYTYHSCPAFYDSDLFAKRLLKAEKEKPVLPVVVVEKISEKLEGANKTKYDCLKDFMNRHHYYQVWDNEKYVILLPSLQSK